MGDWTPASAADQFAGMADALVAVDGELVAVLYNLVSTHQTARRRHAY